MTKIKKKKINLIVYFEYLKKTFLFNLFLAIVLVALFNLNTVNKKKFEIYTYLNIDSDVYRSFNLDHEKHLSEINKLFEENLNSISSLKDNINERLSISSSKISSKTLKFFEIRSLVRVKKLKKICLRKIYLK